MKICLFLCLFIHISRFCFAEIPNDVKMFYGTKMHEAFVHQSMGNSTTAFYSFQDGYMRALQVGENPARLQAILNLFIWYRYHGQGSGLFAIEPSGSDRITGDYPLSLNEFIEHEAIPPIEVLGSSSSSSIDNKSQLLAAIPDYGRYSSPELAELQRDFVFGVGEIIVGLLVIRVGQHSSGLVMMGDGWRRAWNSGNKLYTNKQLAKARLTKILNQVNQVSEGLPRE